MMRCFDYGKLFSGQLIGVALKAGRGDYPPPISGLSSIVRQELSGSPPVNGPDASLARSPAGAKGSNSHGGSQGNDGCFAREWKFPGFAAGPPVPPLKRRPADDNRLPILWELHGKEVREVVGEGGRRGNIPTASSLSQLWERRGERSKTPRKQVLIPPYR